MASLGLKIKPVAKRPYKVRVEIDANQLERLAANFGFYNPEFLDSLDKGESDYKAGRVKKIFSLRELR